MRIGKTGLVVLLLVIVAMARPANAQRRYSVDAIVIDAAVQANGSMEVSETLTYNLRGRYTFAFRDIPRTTGVQIGGIGVSEGAQAYRQSSSNEPGTFKIDAAAASTRVTWYYQATDERRTFNLTYTIEGAVHRYPDTAEVYYKFVGDDWDRPIGSVHATVRFPTPLAQGEVRAWAHGPLTGMVRIDSGGTVGFDVSPLPPRQFWEGRILFPPAVVASLALRSGAPRVDTVLREESTWANEANARREANTRQLEEDARLGAQRGELARLFFPISLVLAVAGVAAWYFAYQRHGSPHEVQPHGAPGEIPSDHPPAVVTYLMVRQIGGPAVVATLLDLARRGYLEICETVETRQGFFGEKRDVDYQFNRTGKALDTVQPFERDLLEFMLNQSDKPTGFTMSAIKKAARKRSRAFHKWFSTWSKSVKADSDARALYEPYDAGALTLNVVIGLAIAIAGITFCVMSRSPAGLPAVLGGILVAALTPSLNRRTAEGQRLFLAWKGFRSHLESLSKSLGPVQLHAHEWSRYLPAAVALSLHKKLLPKLEPIGESGQPAMPVLVQRRAWQFAWGGCVVPVRQRVVDGHRRVHVDELGGRNGRRGERRRWWRCGGWRRWRRLTPAIVSRRSPAPRAS